MKLTNLINNPLILFTGVIFLSACGGGSSSSSSSSSTTDTPSSPTIAAFTSWSVTTADVPVSMTVGSSSAIDLAGNITQSHSSGSATYTRDANNTFTLISPTASSGNSAVFSAALGDTLQSSFFSANTTALNKSQTTIGLFANPFTYSFEYQTYGTWGPYGKTAASSFALSDGSASSGSAIPAKGSLAYSGGATGYFVDPNKFSYITNSNVLVISTFDNRTLNLTTSNTVIQGGPTGNINNNTDLEMVGVLTYVAGTNNFTGTITTTSGMTGTMNGKFYGPSLNEVGGTYAVYGAGIGTMVGSFGGKR